LRDHAAAGAPDGPPILMPRSQLARNAAMRRWAGNDCDHDHRYGVSDIKLIVKKP
jgi:hypothetical protein